MEQLKSLGLHSHRNMEEIFTKSGAEFDDEERVSFVDDDMLRITSISSLKRRA